MQIKCDLKRKIGCVVTLATPFSLAVAIPATMAFGVKVIVIGAATTAVASATATATAAAVYTSECAREESRRVFEQKMEYSQSELRKLKSELEVCNSHQQVLASQLEKNRANEKLLRDRVEKLEEEQEHTHGQLNAHGKRLDDHGGDIAKFHDYGDRLNEQGSKVEENSLLLAFTTNRYLK